MRSAQVKAATGSDPNGSLVRPEGDFFSTHPDATRALLKVERFPGIVWESACGDGAMARVIAEDPLVTRVVATDLHPRGFGSEMQVDFLKGKCASFDHIITNPPFNLVEAFARRAIEVLPGKGKVALLARLAFLEGQRRGDGLWRTHPPARVWVFSKRPHFGRDGGRWQGGLIAFAWYIWDPNHWCDHRMTHLGWLSSWPRSS
jgi:hypothetical protein